MDAVSTDIALDQAAGDIIEAGRRMDRFGWVPSYGGNISARLADGRIAITRSGGRKGLLSRADVIAVDLDGGPLVAGNRPSAETPLHCQVYALLPEVGAVVHGHSVAATVLSRLVPGETIALSGYEMLKAFPGQLTHEATVGVPVFDNSQDMAALGRRVAPVLAGRPVGYVLRGHGVYVWGLDMVAAVANLEALEFLLACELETLRCRPAV